MIEFLAFAKDKGNVSFGVISRRLGIPKNKIKYFLENKIEDQIKIKELKEFSKAFKVKTKITMEFQNFKREYEL